MKTRNKVIISALSTIMILSAIASISGAISTGDIKTSDVTREDWFDARWHYRLFLQVNSCEYMRQDYPVDMVIDFYDYIIENDIIDSNSMRIFDNGTEIPSQYDVINNTAGQLIFVVNGTTAINETRNYTLYFDSEENGLKPVPDYGEPNYITDYEQLAEEGKFLGSSPLNWSTDTWFFPSYLNYSNYDHHERKVGDVKSSWLAWGDGTDDGGLTWIRHYARAVAYRDSFNVYFTLWNNESTSEVVYASGLVNISTGRPSGVNDASKDEGLHVITNNWNVPNISAIDFGCNPVLASGSVYTYNPVLTETYTFNYIGGTDNYQILPQTDSVISVGVDGVWTVIGNVSGDMTAQSMIINPSAGDGISFALPMSDGEEFVLTYNRTMYDWSDELRVNAKNGSTEYLIVYDSDNETGDSYINPQISAIIFPEQIAASDMVVEFWENRTLRAPGDPFFDYLLNISTNYNEWWYNTSLTPSENHDEQENEFEFILSYLNGSVDPEQDVIDFINSTKNPVMINITSQEKSIPISLVVNTPSNGRSFNGWTELPSVPLDVNVKINATILGETIDRSYYKFGDDGTEIDFTGITLVPLSSIEGAALDGKINLHVFVVDTNGTMKSEVIIIFVVKSWYQSLFSGFGTAFIIIVSLVGSFLTACGLASIKGRRVNKNIK